MNSSVLQNLNFLTSLYIKLKYKNSNPVYKICQIVWLYFPEWKKLVSAHCEAYKNLVSNCRRRRHARSTLRKKTTIAITAARKVSWNHQHTFCTHVHSERVNFEQHTLYFHISWTLSVQRNFYFKFIFLTLSVCSVCFINGFIIFNFLLQVLTSQHTVPWLGAWRFWGNLKLTGVMSWLSMAEIFWLLLLERST